MILVEGDRHMNREKERIIERESHREKMSFLYSERFCNRESDSHRKREI